MGVKPRVVRPVAGFGRRADDGLAQRQEQFGIDGGDPRPDDAWPRRVGEGTCGLPPSVQNRPDVCSTAAATDRQSSFRSRLGARRPGRRARRCGRAGPWLHDPPAARDVGRQRRLPTGQLPAQRVGDRDRYEGPGRLAHRGHPSVRPGPAGEVCHGEFWFLRLEPVPDLVAQRFVVLLGLIVIDESLELVGPDDQHLLEGLPGPAGRGRNRRSGTLDRTTAYGDTPAGAGPIGPEVNRMRTDWFLAIRSQGNPVIGVDDDHVLQDPVAVVDDLEACLGALPPGER